MQSYDFSEAARIAEDACDLVASVNALVQKFRSAEYFGEQDISLLSPLLDLSNQLYEVRRRLSSTFSVLEGL